MKIKQHLLYVLLAGTALVAVFSFFKTNSLQNELEETQAKKDELNLVIENYEELAQIDSLLLKGDYDNALISYNKTLQIRKEHKMGIPVRIAIAEKLLRERKNGQASQNNSEEKIDSLASLTANTPAEIRKYDSLSFTLKKTELQLSRLRNRLKDNSLGAYLKFKSKKGNNLHYVGQVKNNKANGFGIALFDSGSRYEGQWNENERSGEGTFYWSDGQYYVGTYTNDKRSGFGTYYWPNGEKYAGQWKEDKRNGTGKFYNTKGEVVAGGEWNDDELVDMNK